MSQLYVCDQCGVSEDSRKAEEWLLLFPRSHSVTFHLCSWKCLAQYAAEEAE